MKTRLTTFISCLIMLLFGMLMTVIGPLLIEIAHSYQLNMTQSGLLFTVNFLGFVLFVLVGGALADHWGKRTILIASLIGLTGSLFLLPLAGNFALLCLALFFIGGFGGIIEVVTASFVSEINTGQGSYYLNLIQVFFGIGAVIGPVSAAIMVTNGLDWRLCYLVLGALAACLTLAFVFSRSSNPRAGHTLSRQNLKSIVTDSKFRLICLCMFLYTGSEIGSWGWLSTFLKQTLQFSLMKAGIATALFWLSMTAGRFICGRLTRHFSLARIIPVLAALSFGAAGLTVLIQNEIAAWVLVALFGFTLSCQWPFIVSYGGEHRRTTAGLEFSLMVAAGGLGGTVIPWLMGLAGDGLGMSFSMLVPTAGLLAVALIFGGFLLKSVRRP